MGCHFDQEILQDLLEENIDPLERIFAEEHLKHCEDCRKELSHMKLLFWELGDKHNFEVALPTELDDLRDPLIDSLIEEKPGNMTQRLFNQQKKVFQEANAYVEFIPGIERSRKLLQYGSKAAPGVLAKASKEIFKGAKTLLAR